jgi:tetratricopeptide (TPR) repeat protein
VAALGLILLPLLAAQACAYFWYRQDDFRLRDIAATPFLMGGESEEVRRISDLTDRERYPDNDRLVLLRRAWKRVGDDEQVDRLTTTMASRNPNNVDLQVALLDVHVKNRGLERAKAVYQHITSLFGYRFLSEIRARGLLVAVARCGANSGDCATASDYFAQALKLGPQDRTLRREYAGILLQDSRPQEALSLYGVAGEERSAADHFLIASAHAQLNRYVEAELECRLALQETPEAIPVRLLLAETLRAAGRRQEAIALYARVAAIDPLNERLRRGLAFDAVGEGDYSKALDLFRSLLAKDSKRPELVRGFIDAAAGADRLSKVDRDLVLRLYEQIDRADRKNGMVLDRLSWALQKMGEYERSAALLRALVLDGGKHRERRLNLAVCLGKLNRDAEADEVLAPLAKDPQGIGVRVGLRLRRGDTASAEKICRELLADSPEEPQILNLLAITLATAKKYQQAEKILQQLARLRPNDLTPQVRMAEVSLWKKDYPAAVARYQQLLGDAFDRPALWQGFADAAAGCKGRLTKDQKQAAIKLATVFTDRKDVGIATLTRLGYALVHAEAPPELTSSLLERAVQNVPRDDVAARKELAGVLSAAGMMDQALQMYEGLPLTVEERGRVVDVYVASGEYNEAEQLARQLCQSRPDDGELRFHLADVLAWSRRYDKAVKVYQEMLEKKPDDSRVQTALALVHLWARRYDKSLSLYRGVLLAHPELKNYYKGYIDAAASATRLDARLDGPIITRLVEWARRNRSEDVDILPRLAWVCQRVGNRPAAVTLLQLACNAAPEDDNLTLQLADLFYDMGRYVEAENQYLVVARRTLPSTGEGKVARKDNSLLSSPVAGVWLNAAAFAAR